MKRRLRWWLARILGAALVVTGVGTGLLLQRAHTAHAATSPTVVTIEFDDGNADAYQALALLNAHGMHATFYVNTGVIGDSAHMSWTQLQSLFTAGNDIGGHTLTHANLKHLKTADARIQVCQDRNNLLSNRFQPTPLSYPLRAFDHGTQQVVAACGYNSGRGVSRVYGTQVYAQTIPPAD